jgi:hypothetical protein
LSVSTSRSSSAGSISTSSTLGGCVSRQLQAVDCDEDGGIVITDEGDCCWSVRSRGLAVLIISEFPRRSRQSSYSTELILTAPHARFHLLLSILVSPGLFVFECSCLRTLRLQ